MATDVAKGGQHAAPIGDSTMHHKCPWDFSIQLANMGGQHTAPQGVSTTDDYAYLWPGNLDGVPDSLRDFEAFEAEQELAGKREQQPF